MIWSDSRTLRLAVVAGIRSQYIKLASFQRSVRAWNVTSDTQIATVSINAGQHYDEVLASSFIAELAVDIDVDLTGKIQPGDPMARTASIMLCLYDYFLHNSSSIDAVVVFGDANTTLAAGLASVKAGVRLVHVEAGVRAGSPRSSEEINRIVADHLADLRFATTQVDYSNLVKEGLQRGTLWSGDIVHDLVVALTSEGLPENALGLSAGSFLLASLHRSENTTSRAVVEAALAALHSFGLPCLFLAHPRLDWVASYVETAQFHNVMVRSGLPYRDTLASIRDCRFVFTDSGAFQRESYYFKKRCVIRQDVAFWRQLTQSGVHATCGWTSDAILEALIAMNQLVEANSPYPDVDDFGDGRAGERILQATVENFASTSKGTAARISANGVT